MAKKKIVDVLFFEKTLSRCPSCLSMKKTLEAWEKKHPEVHVDTAYLPVEQHIDYIQKEHPNIQEAPVIEVHRDGEKHVVSGNNPDILVDYLSGLDSVWDD